jgi:hypothetical protein
MNSINVVVVPVSLKRSSASSSNRLFLLSHTLISCMKMDRRIAAALVIVLSAVALYTYQTLSQEPELESFYAYRVVEKYPHDPEAFTQGLVYYTILKKC